MNKIAGLALLAGALAFTACNSNTQSENHSADHADHDHGDTAGEKLDAALDSAEKAGDEIEAKANALKEDSKSTFEEAKEGVKAGVQSAAEEVKDASKAAAKDVKTAAKKVGQEVNEAAKDVKEDLNKKN